MSELVFPSDQCPGPPVVSVELPDGWEPIVAAGSILAARGQAPAGSFVANLFVTWTRYGAGQVDLDDLAASVAEELAAQPEPQPLEAASVELGGYPAVGRAGVFVDPDAGTVAQFHLLLLAGDDRLADVVHLTATIGGDRVEQDYPTVAELVRSLRVAPATAGPATSA